MSTRIIGIWYTADSYGGQRSCKQHLYIPTQHTRKYTGEKYLANKVACGNGALVDDDEMLMSWDKVSNHSNENMRDNCCKLCKKIYNKLIIEAEK